MCINFVVRGSKNTGSIDYGYDLFEERKYLLILIVVLITMLFAYSISPYVQMIQWYCTKDWL